MPILMLLAFMAFKRSEAWRLPGELFQWLGQRCQLVCRLALESKEVHRPGLARSSNQQGHEPDDFQTNSRGVLTLLVNLPPCLLPRIWRFTLVLERLFSEGVFWSRVSPYHRDPFVTSAPKKPVATCLARLPPLPNLGPKIAEVTSYTSPRCMLETIVCYFWHARLLKSL